MRLGTLPGGRSWYVKYVNRGCARHGRRGAAEPPAQAAQPGHRDEQAQLRPALARCTEPGCAIRYPAGPDRPCLMHHDDEAALVAFYATADDGRNERRSGDPATLAEAAPSGPAAEPRSGQMP